MATLKQMMYAPKVYFGWYGVCPEGGEDACEPFKLVSDTNEHTIMPDGPSNGDTIGASKLIKLIVSFENAVPQTFSGLTNDKGMMQLQTLQELKCGSCYTIQLNPGTDENNLLEFEIPEFVIGNVISDEKETEEYILTTTCGAPPAPPNIALLAPSNLTWEYFTINWNLISYEGSDEPELTLFWSEEDMGFNEHNWDDSRDLGQKPAGPGSFKFDEIGYSYPHEFFYTIRATNSQGETWTPAVPFTLPALEVEESSVLIMTPDVQHRQELQFTINGLHGNEQKIRVYWSYRSDPANHDGGHTSAGGWDFMAEYPTGPGYRMPTSNNEPRNPDGVWTESVVSPSSTTYTYTIDWVDSEHPANQTWLTGNPPGPNPSTGFKDTVYWKVKIYGEADNHYLWLDIQSYVQESSCSVNIGAANNANFPSTAPAKHRAGGSFNWCAGTEYADPGVRQPYPVDCHGDEVEIEVQYWDNQSYVVWHDDPSTAANSHQITNPTEIAKLGLDTIITCDDGTTLGPAPYSFAVFYIATSPLTGGRDTSGRSMWVWNDGDTSQPNWPDYDPCVISDCCSNLLLSTNVVAEQVSEFGSPRVVASGFSYSGELCCGNGSVGTPNSVNLYVNGYTPSVGVISFAGQLDSNEIYLKVTGDPFSSSGVPVMTGECLKGIVNGDECILEIQ